MTTLTGQLERRAAAIVLLLGFVIGFSTQTWAGDPESIVADTAPKEQENVIDSFKVDRNGDLLLIPVTIAEKQHFFILDTGCNTSVFGRELKASLTPTDKKRVVNDGAATEVFECPDAAVGRSRLEAGQLVVSTDLTDIQTLAGNPISGILGMDFLWGRVMQIDFDAGQLSFLNRSTHVIGERVALHRGTDGLPRVELSLPSVGIEQFIVDTGWVGFNSGFLRKAVFNRLVDDAQLELFDGMSKVTGFGGSRQVREGALNWLSLAGARHERQFFTESDSKDNSNGIGLGYLARYKVTFDFENCVMILEKGKRFSRACPVDWAGIDIAVKDGIPVVLDVEKDGPAWKSGVRCGDRLVSVGGDDATKLRLDEIGAMLQCRTRQSSTTVTFTSEGAPFFRLAVPVRSISVKVLRPPEVEPLEFRLWRRIRTSDTHHNK
jgi:hypothetical protein